MAEQAAPPAAGPAARPVPPRVPALPAGWPLVVLLAGFPVFWALGLPNLAAPLMAVPMLLTLMRRRPWKLPRGFVLWVLFLLWSVVAVSMLGVNPPGTLADSLPSRLLGYGMREVSYVAVTIAFLYVGNLTEEELPQRRVVRLLGWLFIWTVAGGVLGMLAPNFQFTSPFELLLPDGIRYNTFVQRLVHPTAAQVQELLGGQTPRPAAPFGYTNTWGYHVTVLGAWFVVGWFVGRRSGARLFAGAVLVVGTVVLIYSLNRAAWVGAIVLALLVVARLAISQRRLLPMMALLLVAAVGTMAIVATPLQDVITGRISEGKSNSVRAFTTEKALELSVRSPIIGYGSTRNAQGSASSIAVGKSADCPQCGNISIGINGYFFMLLMSTGWVGLLLFLAFGVSQLWRVRKETSPLVTTGIAVVVTTGLYGFVYDISTWMLVPAISLAVLWREVQARDRRRLAAQAERAQRAPGVPV